MDRILLAEEKVFAGMAKPGQEWKAGNHVVRLASIDEAAGTARIQVLDGKTVKLDRVLGPVNKDRLIEDTASRKALVFEYEDIAGYLVPWGAIKDGRPISSCMRRPAACAMRYIRGRFALHRLSGRLPHRP